MPQNYIGVRGHAINDKNPFASDLFEMKVSTRTRVMAGNRESINNLIVNKDTGEVLGHQILAVKQKVDKEQFTKIFHKGLAAMWGLTTTGIKVFTYIASQVKPNQDFVYIEIKSAKEFCNYKRDKSIWHGLGELLDAGFIARSDLFYKYYINPTFFFNGSGLTLMNHYEIDDTISEGEKVEVLDLGFKLPPSEK